MEEPAKRKGLIITNADKGGAVVIMDTDRYSKEANRKFWQSEPQTINSRPNITT